MSRTNLRNLISSAAACGLALCAVANRADAVPINGLYIEDSRCDPIPTQSLTHELGNAAIFPPNEAILVQVTPANFTVCVPDDLIANDWVVSITNVSGIAWQDLFFVADLGLTVGNADGNMVDVVLAPGVTTDAFRIDGTVTNGINNNLLGESFGPADEIFAPGETWRFAVSNFFDPAGSAPPPVFNIPGKFAGSELFVGQGSSASILANPVPEPGIVGIVGLVAGALLMRRPRRA